MKQDDSPIFDRAGLTSLEMPIGCHSAVRGWLNTKPFWANLVLQTCQPVLTIKPIGLKLIKYRWYLGGDMLYAACGLIKAF